MTTDPLILSVTPARNAYAVTGGETLVPVLIKLSPGPSASRSLPLNLVLLVDRGAAMGQERRLEFAQQVGKLLTDSLTPQDVFSIVIYGDRAKVLQAAEPATDLDKLRRLIGFLDSHPMGARSELLEGLRAAGEEARRHCTEGRASRIVLLTASQVPQEAEVEQLARALANDNIGLAVFGLGTDWNSALLARLADAGRGLIHYVPRPADLPAEFQQAMTHLRRLAFGNVRLRLKLAQGVRLRRFMRVFPAIGHWLPSQPSDREALVHVGDLAGDQPCYMLAELVVKAGTAGTVRLAQFEVDYQAAGAATPTGSLAPSAVVVSFEQAVGPAAREVASYVDHMQVYALIERALEARKEQGAAKAAQLLANALRVVEGQPGSLLESPLRDAIANLSTIGSLQESKAKALYFASRHQDNSY